MTFNIRFDTQADGPRAWRYRRDNVLKTIRAHNPDLIALQEPDAGQWTDLSEGLPGYLPFGVFDDDTTNPEPHGGFFRRHRFDRLGEGVFWLSDTPSVPHSVSWETDFEPRACGWTLLRDLATGRRLVFASTHFDTNAHAWLPSAITAARELEAIAAGTATILAGDFNCAAGSQAHQYLTSKGGFRDVWSEAGRSDNGVVTFHGFTGCRNLSEYVAAHDVRPGSPTEPTDNYRIDWILIRGELTALTCALDYGISSEQPASDHYPVIGAVEWT